MNEATLHIAPGQLSVLLEQAARRGAEIAITDMVCYHYKDVCKRLNISYNTLQKRIIEGKIHPVDGRITGSELRRYLIEQGRKR